MKIYISYFYQVRHLKPWMVPISTAIFDPKWFHNFGKDTTVFKDKNGIINGLRYKPFAPGPTCDGQCSGAENCKGRQTPDICPFLKNYKIQLDFIDFDSMMTEFEFLKQTLVDNYEFEQEPEFVLMVYETPTNPCSERQSLINWFAEHGYDLQELKYPIKDNY